MTKEELPTIDTSMNIYRYLISSGWGYNDSDHKFVDLDGREYKMDKAFEIQTQIDLEKIKKIRK